MREDYEYERHGVANLFLTVEPLRGRRKVRVTDRRTKCDLAEELRLLADEDYLDTANGSMCVIGRRWPG